MELSWDNCLPSLFVLQCCIVSDTVLLRKKNLWHTSTKWIYIELLSVLLLSLVHPHTRSQVAFYVSLKVQYVEHLTLEKVSVVLQGHAAAPLEVVLLLLCFYFAKKDKCSKQHKAKTDQQVGLHCFTPYKRKIQSLGRALPSFMLDWRRLYATVTQCLTLRYSAVLHFSMGWRYLVIILTSVAVIQSSDNL